MKLLFLIFLLIRTKIKIVRIVGIPISHIDSKPFPYASFIVAIAEAPPNHEAVTVKNIKKAPNFLFPKKYESKSIFFFERIKPKKASIIKYIIKAIKYIFVFYKIFYN